MTKFRLILWLYKGKSAKPWITCAPPGHAHNSVGDEAGYTVLKATMGEAVCSALMNVNGDWRSPEKHQESSPTLITQSASNTNKQQWLMNVFTSWVRVVEVFNFYSCHLQTELVWWCHSIWRRCQQIWAEAGLFCLQDYMNLYICWIFLHFFPQISLLEGAAEINTIRSALGCFPVIFNSSLRSKR